MAVEGSRCHVLSTGRPTLDAPYGQEHCVMEPEVVAMGLLPDT